MVLGTIRKLAGRYQISMDEVTPEMVHEERPTVSVRDVKTVIDFTRGKASLDEMSDEDGVEGEIFKGQDDLEINEFDVLDINVEKVFDAFFNRMSDMEKYFALAEIGCGGSRSSYTASQLSCNELLVNIIAADSKFSKNVLQGDLVIKRLIERL